MSTDRLGCRRRRRLTASVVGLLCAALLAGGFLTPAAPALAVGPDVETGIDPQVRSDPDVLRAESALDGASDELAALQERLDESASAYEHARAHHLRLLEEAEKSADAIESARERTLSAQAAWGQRIATAYKRPEAEASLGAAILGSPDASTAVHRAALVTAVTAHGGDEVTAAQQLAAAATGQARQQHVVGVGTAAAVAEREQHAERLAQLVGSASDGLGDAEVRLSDAEQAATDRAEDRRQAAADVAEQAAADAADARARAERAATEARAQAEQEATDRARAEREQTPAGSGGGSNTPAAGANGGASGGGRAVASAGGQVCPVGTPNGFIDSWGYPRSGGRRHQGVDIFAARGTPLYAVADGVVSRVSSNSLGGLMIDLKDDRGNRYYYAHLHTQAAREGQRVRAGDVIGTVGNTGNARTTPPHLHWQYHPGNGAAVNPYPLAAKLCKGT